MSRVNGSANGVEAALETALPDEVRVDIETQDELVKLPTITLPEHTRKQLNPVKTSWYGLFEVSVYQTKCSELPKGSQIGGSKEDNFVNRSWTGYKNPDGYRNYPKYKSSTRCAQKVQDKLNSLVCDKSRMDRPLSLSNRRGCYDIPQVQERDSDTITIEQYENPCQSLCYWSPNITISNVGQWLADTNNQFDRPALPEPFIATKRKSEQPVRTRWQNAGTEVVFFSPLTATRATAQLLKRKSLLEIIEITFSRLTFRNRVLPLLSTTDDPSSTSVIEGTDHIETTMPLSICEQTIHPNKSDNSTSSSYSDPTLDLWDLEKVCKKGE